MCFSNIFIYFQFAKVCMGQMSFIDLEEILHVKLSEHIIYMCLDFHSLSV